MTTDKIIKTKTVERQYEVLLDAAGERGFERLGIMSSESFYEDPKHLLFTLSRYKFVSKMLSGRKNVLEIGCGDGFATRLVQAEVSNITAVEFDPVFIEDIKKRTPSRWRFDIIQHDVLTAPVPGDYDAIYSLDVLEHIEAAKEKTFIINGFSGLKKDGLAIIGMPTIESQQYASSQSKIGHVNCKTASDLKELLQIFFENVLIFSMNDEVVHTGFYKMAHYLFAVCSVKKI